MRSAPSDTRLLAAGSHPPAAVARRRRLLPAPAAASRGSHLAARAACQPPPLPPHNRRRRSELYLLYVVKVLESYNYFSLSRSLALYLTEEFGVGDYTAGFYYGWAAEGTAGACHGCQGRRRRSSSARRSARCRTGSCAAPPLL